MGGCGPKKARRFLLIKKERSERPSKLYVRYGVKDVSVRERKRFAHRGTGPREEPAVRMLALTASRREGFGNISPFLSRDASHHRLRFRQPGPVKTPAGAGKRKLIHMQGRLP